MTWVISTSATRLEPGVEETTARAGHDGVGAAGKQGEHARGIGGGFGLAEDEVARQHDGGVGGEDGNGLAVVLVKSADGLRLFNGEPLNIGGGGLLGEWAFVNVSWFNDKGEAGLGEEFVAARGGGGEDKHGYPSGRAQTRPNAKSAN